MNNKLLCLSVFTSASLLLPFGSVSASPLVSIGDNTDIYFNGSTSLRWSSNVFLNETDEEDDLIWTISPGFEVNVGRGLSNADLSIITRYDIIRYEEQDQLDVELFHIKAIGSYKSSRLDLNGSVSYDEEKSNSGENNFSRDLIETDNYAASLNAEYRVSPKFSLGSGISYREREYQAPFDDRFADRETISVPLDVFYELTPKIDLSIGYKYTGAEVEDTYNPTTDIAVSGYDTEDHFFNVGARGNLLPKVSGFFKVGYRVGSQDDSIVTFDPDGAAITSTRSRDDKSTLGVDADLTWTPTPKITARLGLSRDFGIGGEGQTSEDTSFDLSASYSINSYFALSGSLGYTMRDYINFDRDDDQYDAGIRLSYTPSQYWRFSAGYSYEENDSTSDFRSYEAHTFDLTATLRY